MAKNEKPEKVANIFQRYQNPLRGLTSSQIENLFQQARHGNDVRLQLAYHQMEMSTPIFQVCLSKRISGVLERAWDIIKLEESEEATAQQEAVKRAFLKSDTLNDNGLTDAIRHLCLSTFRGRAVVKPFFNGNDLFFKCLDNWNVLLINGKLYWNPKCEETYSYEEFGLRPELEEIPEGEVCCLTTQNNIDYAGLVVYLRQLVGEEKWAKVIEKQGIPQVLLTVPEGTPDQQLAVWNFRAQAIYEGASGTLPANTKIQELTKGRDSNPFESFLNYQARLISIMSTGGTALTLGDTGGGLGSDLVAEQKKQFNSLVSQDCKRISNAITNCVVKKMTRKLFGKDPLVRFEFIEDDTVTPDQYVDLALKVQQLGGAIDLKELKRLTKLPFILDEQKDVWKPEEA